METWKVGSVILFVIAVSSCGKTWINLDDSSADSVRVKEAKLNCKVDDMIIELSHKELALKTAIIHASSDAAKESLKQDLVKLERDTSEKINSCMANEGLKPGR